MKLREIEPGSMFYLREHQGGAPCMKGFGTNSEYFCRGKSFYTNPDTEVQAAEDPKPRQVRFSSIKNLMRFTINGNTWIKVSDEYAVLGDSSSFFSPGKNTLVDPAQ